MRGRICEFECSPFIIISRLLRPLWLVPAKFIQTGYMCDFIEQCLSSESWNPFPLSKSKPPQFRQPLTRQNSVRVRCPHLTLDAKSQTLLFPSLFVGNPFLSRSKPPRFRHPLTRQNSVRVRCPQLTLDAKSQTLLFPSVFVGNLFLSRSKPPRFRHWNRLQNNRQLPHLHRTIIRFHYPII